MKISSSVPPGTAGSTVSAASTAHNAEPSNQNPELAKLRMEIQRLTDEIKLRIARNIAGTPDPKNNAAWDQYAAQQREERDATSNAALQSPAMFGQSPEPAEQISRIVGKRSATGTAV